LNRNLLLNEIQDSAIRAITNIRNSFQIEFSDYSDENPPEISTIKNLVLYLSDRSQAISFLASAGYLWDAEIVLRSFYETAAKIWYISFSPASKRGALVDEFWNDLSQIHARKTARKAEFAHDSHVRRGESEDTKVFRALMRKELFDFEGNNKAKRKEIEQRWSFAEIMSYLSKNPIEGMQLADANSLLHMYGQASHLLHADEAALNLMIDRAMRPKAELDILKAAHLCRIWSDQVSLWTFCLVGLRFIREKAELFDDLLIKNFNDVHALTKPIADEFHESQAEFYCRILQDDGKA